VKNAEHTPLFPEITRKTDDSALAKDCDLGSMPPIIAEKMEQ